MFYREAGQFKATYQEDLQAFPIRQDKIGIGIWLAIAYLYIPVFRNSGIRVWVRTERHNDPGFDLHNHDNRIEYLGRVYGPNQPWHRRLYGGGCVLVL